MKQWHRFSSLGVLLPALFMLNLCLGSAPISIEATLDFIVGNSSESAEHIILQEIRLPKALTAILAGASLSIAGLILQTLFRNPLADPFVLGINSGASLGVALILLLSGTSSVFGLLDHAFVFQISTITAASIGAATVLALIIAISKRVSIMTLLIIGLMIGYACNAASSILIYFSLPEHIQNYLLWTFGDFGSVTWSDFPFFASFTVIAILLSAFSIKSMNAWIAGENYARSVGAETHAVRYILLISSALLAAVTTTYCGPIAFIGIAVPHLCRQLFQTANHRVLLPACILLGASLALLADLIAQVPGSSIQLPLNAVTSIIGAPFIILYMLKQRNVQFT